VASPIGRELRRYSATNFSGGLDVKTSPQLLASMRKYANRLTLARHVNFPREGGVTKMFDQIPYNTVSLGASVQITGGYQFRHSNGTDYTICGTSDGRVVKLNTDGTTANLVTGKTGTRWYFTNFNDLAIITNRVDAPMKWDGTTFGTLGGTPPATGGPAVVHSNRVIFLEATDVRKLTWSKLNDPEDYTAAGNAGSAVVTGRFSSPLVSLTPMTSELLLGHRDFVSRLQGTAPSTYAIANIVPAQVSLGSISPQGTAFGNNAPWWISQRGIHSLNATRAFGDLEEKFASDLIDPYFMPDTEYTVTLANLSLAAAVYDQQNNRLMFGVDSNADGKNDLLVIRDVATGAWSTCPGVSCASLWTAYSATTGRNDVFMGGYDGFVRRLNVNASTNAIDARFNHISDLGDPGWVKTLRYVYPHVKEQGAYNLNVHVNTDFGASGGQVFPMSLLGATDTLGLSFTLGTSTLGGRSQIIKRLEMGITGEYFEMGFANAQAGQPFTVFSYDTLARRRRIVGRGVTL
jgi:hypothetical protein